MPIRPPARPPARAPRPAPSALWDGEEEPPPGCGWFELSHELQSGLWVREHASADEVAADLPLQARLDLRLAGRPGLHSG